MTHFSLPNIAPEKFIFDYSGQFHALKHFTFLDDDYLRELMKEGSYSKGDLSKRMQKFGSKFLPAFISNPLEAVKLLEKEREYALHYRMRTESRIEIQLVFDMAWNPEGIGWDSLIPKAGFTPDQEIKVRNRSGFPIEYTSGAARPTWKMHFIFTQLRGDWRLVTFFPGKYAPPFPDRENQSDKEFEEYAAFWNKHIFLVK